MRTCTLLSVVALVVTVAGATPAKSENQRTPDNPLNQLAWMTGGKWVAEGEKGPDGKPFHAEWSCAWGKNGRTLKFTVMFLENGKLVPVYDGLYAWHPGRQKLVFLYTDNQGDLTEGEAVMSGDRLEQDFQIVGMDGVARPFRSTIVRRGPDDYDWNVLHLKEGKWEEMFALKYKRQRD